MQSPISGVWSWDNVLGIVRNAVAEKAMKYFDVAPKSYGNLRKQQQDVKKLEISKFELIAEESDVKCSRTS